MHDPTPLQLAEELYTKQGFVWLDSLVPEASHPNNPREKGLSILAAEPDLILEGSLDDWTLLEKEVVRRSTSFTKQEKSNSGAAIGFFRYDGSFCFGFYENVYRHQANQEASYWLAPRPEITFKKTATTQLLEALSFASDVTAAEFCESVRLAQEEIAAGNIYQVCLAHRFIASCQGNPWPIYLALRKKSPAPFAAYLQLGTETILSSSPECFLKMEERHIVTRPIKGTLPRGSTLQEDAQHALKLQQSPKENAELIMITDLLRNDLGQICDYGTVTTPQLLQLEEYPHVFHLVSTIEGKLRKEVSHVKALAACFPGGSISGAPKKKALEIIEQLELAPRGIFTGAIGYFGFDGKSQFNIAIRTMTVRDGMAEFHVGAGITSDSIPEEEWEETLHKAAGILAATG